jgi:murein DD-endopeptidase MepM/ murein hydrolase activator NlpD
MTTRTSLSAGPPRLARAALSMSTVAPLASTAAGAVSASAAQPSGAVWVWPLQPTPRVVRPFEPPSAPWTSGHRGVDLLGSPAQAVHAIGAGDVTYAGTIAGRGVVVVRHEDVRSSYEPVTASVHAGEHVSAGQVIGVLQTTGSHCAPQACLHLGLRRGTRYLDPLALLGPRPVRLKPLTSPGPGQGSRVPATLASKAAADVAAAVGAVVESVVPGGQARG